MPTKTRQEVEDQILDLAKTIGRIEDEIKELEERLGERRNQWRALLGSLAGGAATPADPGDEESPRPSSSSTEPLNRRVMRQLGAMGSATAEQIADAMGEDLRRVTYCLQDQRSKKKRIDKPRSGKWKLNEAGREYLASLDPPA